MRDARARDEKARRGELSGAVRDADLLATELDAATRRVAHARAVLAAAIASRDALLAGAGRGTPGARLAIAAIARHDSYLGRLRRDLDAATDEHLRADARYRGQLGAVDLARQRLTLARAEREVIERHFAAWRAERRKLAERRDD